MEGNKLFKSLITTLVLLEKKVKKLGRAKPSSVPVLASALLPPLPSLEHPKAAAGGKSPLWSPKHRPGPSRELLDASLKAWVGAWRGPRLLSPPRGEPLAVKPRADNRDGGITGMEG